MAIIDFQWMVEKLNRSLPTGYGARVTLMATESTLCIEIYKDGLLSKRVVAVLRLGSGRDLFDISWVDPIDSITLAVGRL